MAHAAHVADEHPPDKPWNSHSNVYEAARVVKSGAGVLYGFTVYNSGAAQFVLVFDDDQLPANGAVPECVFAVGATAHLPIGWIPGRTFRRGCVIANSSTGPTLTAGSADCFIDAQYI